MLKNLFFAVFALCAQFFNAGIKTLLTGFSKGTFLGVGLPEEANGNRLFIATKFL